MKKSLQLLSLFLVLLLTSTVVYSASGSALLKRKVATCSPFIFKGNKAVIQVMGWYNRRCIVRAATINETMECTLKKGQLEDFSTAFDIDYLDDFKAYNYASKKQALEALKDKGNSTVTLSTSPKLAAYFNENSICKVLSSSISEGSQKTKEEVPKIEDASEKYTN